MVKNLNKSQCRTKGFTLIELIITVALIGIIVAAGWPSYERYQQKGRRADGIGALLQNSAQLEKCFINNNGTYVGCAITSPSPLRYYSITANPVLAAESYTLEARPINAQAGDGECATLTLNHLGEKGFSTTNVAPDPVGNVKRCWSQ